MNGMVITRIDFIQKFNKIIEHVFDIELPESGTEEEMLEKAYDIVYKKLIHIKGGGK